MRRAAGRTWNTDVLGLAAQIIAAQQPEIDTMSGWLKSWDKEVPADSSDMGEMEGMDHGSSSDMPGMMSDEDMASLEASSGSAFDEQFLTMMFAHHKGAIEMASQEEVDGTYNHAVDLAKRIRADQTAEISTMQKLLSS
ncbi:DUF305 domain-containing protein [Aeromicrobium endophyticum]|uniref:DUF305 domain-containing protein n=1 Tax=Aeromicrobium endophyticum TaxID=2292704 RepID=UPI0018F5A449|nr:DUF305 domain-containing protein [Aeromicrobium endophyticum]